MTFRGDPSRRIWNDILGAIKEVGLRPDALALSIIYKLSHGPVAQLAS